MAPKKAPTMPDGDGIIYLIWLREFISLRKPIYKMGRTKLCGNRRFEGYPKDSIIITQQYCQHHVKVEGYIIGLFCRKYKPCPDIGREYFEGDAHMMKEDIYKACTPLPYRDVHLFDISPSKFCSYVRIVRERGKFVLERHICYPTPVRITTVMHSPWFDQVMERYNILCCRVYKLKAIVRFVRDAREKLTVIGAPECDNPQMAKIPMFPHNIHCNILVNGKFYGRIAGGSIEPSESRIVNLYIYRFYILPNEGGVMRKKENMVVLQWGGKIYTVGYLMKFLPTHFVHFEGHYFLKNKFNEFIGGMYPGNVEKYEPVNITAKPPWEDPKFRFDYCNEIRSIIKEKRFTRCRYVAPQTRELLPDYF